MAGVLTMGLGSMWFGLHRPILGDDVAAYQWIVRSMLYWKEVPLEWRDSWSGFIHPPLYWHVLGGWMACWGDSVAAMRALGAVGWLVTIGLIAAFFKFVSPTPFPRRSGLIACVIYAVSPYAIQGALHPDIDTVMLPAAMMMFIVFDAASEDRWNERLIKIGAGIILGFIAWVKLQGWLVLVLGLWLRWGWERWRGGKTTCPAWTLGLITAIGAGVFMVTWFGYGLVYGRPFDTPFVKLWSAFMRMQPQSETADRAWYLAQNGAGLLVWLSFPLTAWGAWAWWKWWRGDIDRRFTLAAILMGLMTFGYLNVGGLSNGFPRYHYPMFAMWCIMAAAGSEALWKEPWSRWCAMVTAAAFIAGTGLWWAGDIIDLVVFRIRAGVTLEGLSFWNSARPVMIRVGVVGVMSALAVGAVKAVLSRSIGSPASWAAGFMAAWLGWSVVMNVHQARAEYATTTCYGMRGTAELIRTMNDLGVPQDRVLVTDDLLYLMNYPRKRYDQRRGVWDTPEHLAVALLEAEALVYSSWLHGVKDYRRIFRHPRVQETLDRLFEGRRVGSYLVWIRKT